MKDASERPSVVIAYADNTGGVRRASLDLQRVLQADGISVQAINLYDFGASRFYVYLGFLKFLLRADVRVRHVLMHFDPIIVGLMAACLRPRLRCRMTNVYHTDLYAYFHRQRGIRKSIFRFLVGRIKNLDSVFVSREMMMKAQAGLGFSNCRVIYNAFDCDEAGVGGLKVSSLPWRPGKEVVLGAVTRLHGAKNIDLSIRLVRELRNRGYNVKLDIYGAGPEKAALMDYVQRLHAVDFVSFKGFLQDASAAYQAIDGLICLSSMEGWGLTILESIRAGKPVFQTDCSCGPREIMRPDSNPLAKTDSFEETDVGFLVKPLIMQHSYADHLSGDEGVYVDYLALFVDRLGNNGFSMIFDFERFFDVKARADWLDALGVMGDDRGLRTNG